MKSENESIETGKWKRGSDEAHCSRSSVKFAMFDYAPVLTPFDRFEIKLDQTIYLTVAKSEGNKFHWYWLEGTIILRFSFSKYEARETETH